MKELLMDLAAYHYWADQRILDALKSLPEEMLDKEIPSSFPSLRKTLYHLWDAENTWIQRLKLQEPILPPSRGFTGNFDEFSGLFLQCNQSLEEWIGKTSEQGLLHVVAYYNSKHEQLKNPVYQCLVQVLNHATYHRGQLVTMLRFLGITKIPATDYIAFKRTKK